MVLMEFAEPEPTQLRPGKHTEVVGTRCSASSQQIAQEASKCSYCLFVDWVGIFQKVLWEQLSS